MRQPDLPIFEIEPSLLEILTKQKRLVLTAPTGSGKSTQVPQMLLDGGLLGDGQVTVLQPRRLPTRMLAKWVAQTRGVKLGGAVGYQMRLDNVTSPATRICFATEGVLLRRMLADPDLKGVSAILFDEFHERHLYGDITLARALEIQESTRPDLIILVMSATLDVATVEKYLHPCALLSSAGRTYPVAIEYLPRTAGERPVWELAVKELQRLVREHSQGDALIFMPGAYEIARTVQAARAALGQEFVVFPLHGELPPVEQDAAVARYDRRKIVVATNVAETSLTIDGVRLVIDSGLARIPRYDSYRGINTLLVEKISRAAADQRAGRAGRTAPGHCLRLWTAHEQSARPAQELAEVKRLDLSEVILTLKASGVNDAKSFRWLEPPDPRALERAETLLIDLDAIDGATGAITALGQRMLAFPVHPRYARMLLAAQEYGCVRSVALIAALTQGRDLLMRRQGKQVEDPRDDLLGAETESDFFVLMRAWCYAERNGYHVEGCRRMGVHAQAARQVGPLFEQFLRIAADEGLDISEKPVAQDAVQRCVLVGFSDHLAKRLDAGSLRCALVHSRRGVLARESVVKAPLFVASEIREVESGGGRERNLNVMLNLATAVKEEWLRELFPNDFKAVRAVAFDPTLRRQGNVELAGYYQFDDEGVKARRVNVVENGVFKNFLMSRSPIAGFDHSNGHGRAAPGFAPVARQSNLVVTSTATVSHDSLKQMLIGLVKEQHKPYGLIFDDIEGGFTMTQRTIPNAFNVLPIMVYRVFPDGREELVRGVDLVGTPLTVFSRVVAADNVTSVFNGVCGAESGWVPVSAASPAILISQIEVQRKDKSQQQAPILPAPRVQP